MTDPVAAAVSDLEAVLLSAEWWSPETFRDYMGGTVSVATICRYGREGKPIVSGSDGTPIVWVHKVDGRWMIDPAEVAALDAWIHPAPTPEVTAMPPAPTDRQTAGLTGLIAQLPRKWTAEQRSRWLDAMVLVLDFTVTLIDTPEPEPAVTDPEQVTQQ